MDEGALPLLARFPALAALPRARLGRFPSPVELVHVGGSALWLKRDDLNVEPPYPGGNKVRALEFLLGAVAPGDTVLTLGGEGSTHVLVTALHAARLGARTVAVRWPHEMNPTATVVAAAAERACARIVRTPHAAVGLALAGALAPLARRRRRTHVVPLGGSTPLGTLGHVNAALELAAQVEAGLLPAPRRVVVPLGSGGTAAGLLLGLAIAGLPTRVVGARVAPRIGTNRRRVLALARGTARLIARRTGGPAPTFDPDALVVEHRMYAGAYGRSLPAGAALGRALAAAHGPTLDGTYGEKGLAAALAAADDGPTLYWVTFDARAV